MPYETSGSENLKRIAQEREFLHRNHKSSRPLSLNYEYIGLKGEAKFAEEFGMLVDTNARPAGDKGTDFSSVIGSIDIKTARKAWNLIVEEGKVLSEVYVLAKYTDQTDEIELLGWEYKDKILNSPKIDFGYGIINHYISSKKLKPMSHLKNAIFNKQQKLF